MLQQSSETEPLPHRRSDLYRNNAFITDLCFQNYTLQTGWIIYKVENATIYPVLSGNITTNLTSNPAESYTKILRYLDFSFNPTLSTTELTIKSNNLKYGVHKIVYLMQFQVIVRNFTKIKQTQFNSTGETFIDVTVSGIAVFGITNGNDYAVIGSEQGFEIDPPTHSFDMDYIYSTKDLTFKMYCWVYSSSLSYENMTMDEYFALSPTKMTDLFTYHNTSGTGNVGCFNSTCNQFIYSV